MVRRRAWVGSVVALFFASGASWVEGCVGDSSTPTDGGGPDTTTDTNNNPDTSTNDAGVDAPTDADAAPAPFCTPTKAFGPVTLVPTFGNADSGSSGARLTNDSLTIYYAANPSAALNGLIQTASRASLAAQFNTPVPVAALSDAGISGLDPSISPDGLTLYTQFNPSNFVEVMYATRLSADAGFSTPTGVTGLSGAAPNHGSPFLQGDNSTLFYAARVSPDGGATQGGGSLDIFYGSITGQGQFSNVLPENELNTTFDETSPAITPDGLTIYFARKEGADGGSSGTFHVYTATRGAKNDPFPTPTLVPELDDMPTTNTSPTWISPDTCVIWLQSDRGGPAGGIYTATKPL